MPKSCTFVYVHFVWATWDRLPYIAPSLEPSIYACIASKCQELKSELLAIGGTQDHVHVLVRLHSTVAVAELAKGMKGASSHLVTHELTPNQAFKWQGSYGAFSVSPSDVPRIRAYVRNQKKHHASGDVWEEWERCEEIEDDVNVR
jgi:REP element-mobilizing transposase RayT